MDNLSIEQLEQAQTALITRMRQAKGGLDYLERDISRLIIGNVLGTISIDEVRATRQLIAECNQTLEETPAALAIIKVLIAQVRSQEAREQSRERTKQARQSYIELRQKIIENPSLADNYVALGKLAALSHSAFGPHKNGEVRELEAAAREYNSRKRSEPFSFDVLIPE